MHMILGTRIIISGNGVTLTLGLDITFRSVSGLLKRTAKQRIQSTTEAASLFSHARSLLSKD